MIILGGISKHYKSNGGGPPPPTFTINPTISGTAVVGQTLSVSFTLNNADTATRKWYRNGVLVFTSTTSNDYVLVQADAGNTSNIKCNVEGSNGAGSVNADSNTIARILDTLTNNYITGLTLTSAEIDSFNTLYLAIRSNSYHTIIDNLIIYATATNAAALKPLFGSNTITPVNSPTWSRAVGYTHTGTSYINRGTSSNVNLTRDNHCYMIGISNKNTTTNGLCGGQTAGSSGLVIAATNAGTASFGSLAAALDNNVFTRTITNKDYAMRRQISTQFVAYQDGVASANLPRVTSNPPPTAIFDGAYNGSGSPINIFESGAISEYSLQGSGAIDPSVMRTIIRNFINSL